MLPSYVDNFLKVHKVRFTFYGFMADFISNYDID